MPPPPMKPTLARLYEAAKQRAIAKRRLEACERLMDAINKLEEQIKRHGLPKRRDWRKERMAAESGSLFPPPETW